VRTRISYSNVISTLALFVALGGGAYAAGVLPKNSVGTQQLKKNAVTSAKVKDRSLLAKDFKAGQLPAGARGATGPGGPQGQQGIPGEKGAKGDQGDPGNLPSTYAENGGVTLPDTGTAMTAVDLASVNAGAVDHQITTKAAGRIMAIGQSSIYNNAAAGGQVGCRLQVSDGTGPTNGLTDMSQEGWTNFPATQYWNNLYSVSGSVVKEAGTYNVRLLCYTADNQAVTASLNSLTVWAGAP
jgi:hypothetical protein